MKQSSIAFWGSGLMLTAVMGLSTLAPGTLEVAQ